MKANLIEPLFPRFCLGCGYVGTYVCPNCERLMKKINKPHCFYCGEGAPLGITHPRCAHKKGIDGFLSLYFYDGLFQRVLHVAKYQGAHLVLHSLLLFPQQGLGLALRKWERLFGAVSMSIPLHPQRIRERGFNQSEIVVRHYFERPPRDESLLVRATNTRHLAKMNSGPERKKHIRGAFRYCGSKNPPPAAILVDDVVTTGSTARECARVLKENGVRTVLLFSLASGLAGKKNRGVKDGSIGIS